jgi:AraC-like DNA-binding protein
MNYPRLYFYRRIVQAKLFIDQHYVENIELFTIADEAYYSKFHFIRQFKKTYQQTPHQYVMNVRINKAMELLAGGMPVAGACKAVGFEELSSFSRLFKRKTGLNPSAYRNQQQKLRHQIAAAPLSVIPHCFAYQYGWVEKEQFATKEV